MLITEVLLSKRERKGFELQTEPLRFVWTGHAQEASLGTWFGKVIILGARVFTTGPPQQADG